MIFACGMCGHRSATSPNTAHCVFTLVLILSCGWEIPGLLLSCPSELPRQPQGGEFR